MGWVQNDNAQADVIKADMNGLESSLSTEFEANIDECAAWNGEFSGRMKREAGDLLPAVFGDGFSSRNRRQAKGSLGQRPGGSGGLGGLPGSGGPRPGGPLGRKGAGPNGGAGKGGSARGKAGKGGPLGRKGGLGGLPGSGGPRPGGPLGRQGAGPNGRAGKGTSKRTRRERSWWASRWPTRWKKKWIRTQWWSRKERTCKRRKRQTS